MKVDIRMMGELQPNAIQYGSEQCLPTVVTVCTRLIGVLIHDQIADASSLRFTPETLCWDALAFCSTVFWAGAVVRVLPGISSDTADQLTVKLCESAGTVIHQQLGS